MKRALRFVAEGIYSMADAYTDRREYVYPAEGGFARDQARLRGDALQVGNDMRQAIDKRGKQQHESSGD